MSDEIFNTNSNQDNKSGFRKWIVIIGIALLGILILLILWPRINKIPKNNNESHSTETEHSSNEVVLEADTLKTIEMQTVEATERSITSLLHVTGTIEANQQQAQQVTPLISGRVEYVYVALGDRVKKGKVLAEIASPQIAEMHGKLHESETRLAIAERNLARVRQPENRASVLQAKAKLDEAEATLNRTRKLIDLGAGAGKDLTAAEAIYRTAKAEYDFQSSITLNREVQEAQAAVETAQVDVAHIRDGLRAFGAPVPEGKQHSHDRDTSLVPLRAPLSGTVTERTVNVGAGVETGKFLFTIANITNIWVIANVPETQVRLLRIGTNAQVRTAGSEEVISGRINYIDPTLNEETRTARVRVEIPNPDEHFKIGSFVEITFGTKSTNSVVDTKTLVIPDEAVQRIGERTIVFIPKDVGDHYEGKSENKEEAKEEKKEKLIKFEVREVKLGDITEGLRHITEGLNAGEQVVTKGSFTLKTQLMKGELGEEH